MSSLYYLLVLSKIVRYSKKFFIISNENIYIQQKSITLIELRDINKGNLHLMSVLIVLITSFEKQITDNAFWKVDDWLLIPI